MPNTEQIIKVLKNERECIKRQIGITAPDGSIGICDRICAECDLCLPDDEILEVYDHLISEFLKTPRTIVQTRPFTEEEVKTIKGWLGVIDVTEAIEEHCKENDIGLD